MNVKNNKINLELSSEEALIIACHIKCSIKESIKRHYVSLQDVYDEGYSYVHGIFSNHERKDIEIMKKLFRCSDGGCAEHHEQELFNFLKEEYEKTKTKQPKE